MGQIEQCNWNLGIHTKIIREWSIHFTLGPLYLLKSHINSCNFSKFFWVWHKLQQTVSVRVHVWVRSCVCNRVWYVCARLQICEISNNFAHSQVLVQKNVWVGKVEIIATFSFDNLQSIYLKKRTDVGGCTIWKQKLYFNYNFLIQFTKTSIVTQLLALAWHCF